MIDTTSLRSKIKAPDRKRLSPQREQTRFVGSTREYHLLRGETFIPGASAATKWATSFFHSRISPSPHLRLIPKLS
jgi:hypothetical protein